MIRVSEMVLPGHPDKFCDQVFLTGGIATARPLAEPLAEIVRRTGRELGYVAGNAIDAHRYVVHSSVCDLRTDATQWTPRAAGPRRQADRAAAAICAEPHEVYAQLQARDRRWVAEWRDVEVLVNPNGPLVNGGSDGDNGQTGRKLAVDYYGPRVPTGGGALSGKDLSHIDRAAAYALRQAAIHGVQGGARECQVTGVWAPNVGVPLDVIWQLDSRGRHFFDLALPWNGEV